jgi:transcriptional regulator with XRE-family HTH domain
VSLGLFLRELRQSRRLTLAQAGARAGVAFSTLSRWEGGQYQPRLPELEAVLAALDVSPRQRTQALALVEAPRAVVRIREEAEARLPEMVEVAGHAPAVGDLLRAMRRRRGLTTEQVGRTLGVQPSTIRRWEASEMVVREDRLPDLCRALGAAPEEQEALSRRHLHLWTPDESARLSLDALEARLRRLHADMARGERVLMDLRFLILEAQLWALAARSASARHLLARTYAYHGAALEMWGRYREIKPYADRALDLLMQASAPDRAALYLAVRLSGVTLLTTSGQISHRRAIAFLRPWVGYAETPSWQTGLYRDMAEWACGNGQLEAALGWIAKASETAEHAEDLLPIRAARHIYRHILLTTRAFDAALPLLPQDEETDPFQLAFEVGHRVQTLLGVGERDAAHDWLNHLYTHLRAYDLPLAGAESLAHLFDAA